IVRILLVKANTALGLPDAVVLVGAELQDGPYKFIHNSRRHDPTRFFCWIRWWCIAANVKTSIIAANFQIYLHVGQTVDRAACAGLHTDLSLQGGIRRQVEG